MAKQKKLVGTKWRYIKKQRNIHKTHRKSPGGKKGIKVLPPAFCKTNKLYVFFVCWLVFCVLFVVLFRFVAFFLANRRRHKNYGWTQEKAWKAQ